MSKNTGAPVHWRKRCEHQMQGALCIQHPRNGEGLALFGFGCLDVSATPKQSYLIHTIANLVMGKLGLVTELNISTRSIEVPAPPTLKGARTLRTKGINIILAPTYFCLYWPLSFSQVLSQS